MSFSKPEWAHIDHTIEEKLNILNKLDCGTKAVEICKQFNLSQSTLSTWKKQHVKLRDMVDSGKVLKTKRNRESFLPQVERALNIWFRDMTSRAHPHHLVKLFLFRRPHSKCFECFELVLY